MGDLGKVWCCVAVTPVAVSLKANPELHASFSREQRLSAIKAAADYARAQFVNWLIRRNADIDLDRDLGPPGWRDRLVPIVVVQNCETIIRQLRQPSDRPDIVESVCDVPKIVVEGGSFDSDE